MASLTQLLYTARDALSAQSFGLGVTGQNVSNANTPGYVRRDAMLSNVVLGNQGYGGVEALGVRRATDAFLDRRVFEASSLASAASRRDTELAGVESLLDDFSGTGLADSLSKLFGSFDALSQSPNDPTARQTVLESAQAVAARVRETADSIATMRDSQLERGRAVITEINEKASRIAELNRQIAIAEAQGKDTSDLQDLRHQALLDLSTKVDVHTFTSDDGSLAVQAAGTTLVEGNTSRTLSLDLSSSGTLRLFAERTGGPPTEITSQLKGGELAGIKEARDEDLVALGDRLDQLAFDLASAVNAQHAAGYGLDGVTGRNLFDVSATVSGAARSLQLSTQVAGSPDKIAASSSATTLPGGSDNAALLAQLAAQKVASGNTRTLGEAYADLVGDVGTRKAQAETESQLRQSVLGQADALRESESGVSLDEEMVNLTRYQRAYQAAAKVLTTVDELMQELLARVGR
ncbi:MAG: flagellar hook-associated protein FlgK [Myxococcales bacterium]|nr:flagellar hook-associated protein FlgK [Myxococcales bacterium]MCB9579354.1 flagellar hook-associated protein FlgK [Polyangiaceae bacterium]